MTLGIIDLSWMVATHALASALPVARQRDRRRPLSHVIAMALFAVAIVGSSSLSAGGAAT